MPTDLEVIRQLEKEIGVSIDRGGCSSTSPGYLTDSRENVTALSLAGANLTEFPRSIMKLRNLTKLDLTENRLTELPAELTQLKKLEFLWLLANRLKRIPPVIFELKGLVHFGIGRNEIGSLPSAIGNLKDLGELNLYNNKLTSLPKELADLNSLNTLQIGGNPLKEPPPEIVRQGIKAIFEYLRRLPEEKREELVNEAKLLLVGQGDVGKTCLAKRLMFGAFQKEKSTEGIDILAWPIPTPAGDTEQINLNVWDFGGQEIYHATHQFFLTKRSVYVLVWNARKSRDYEHIYYWLHTVEAFAENSPVILVMTKQNERDDDLNMKDLKEKFPQIVGLYKVDCEDGTGIAALKKIISKTAWNLPQMQTPWIDSWFKVRQRLEQDERDWIQYKEYTQICRAEGLDRLQTHILDEYLHDLGVIIHFCDRIQLRDMVILRPEWATDAVYKVLDTQSVRDADGVLLHSELEQIWDPKIYPPEIFPQLLDIMNKFELAYELGDNKSHLVAELLPSTEPDFEWDNTDNLRFYYRYDFVPAGVMSRFIVLVHQDLETQADGKHWCWREGAVLQRESTRAFVKLWKVEKLVEIRIVGRKKRELLAIIRYHFDHINRTIRKIRITQQVPCNCAPDCAHRFDYEQLLKAESLGKESVDCPATWGKVPLVSLLDGYQKKEDRMKDIAKLSEKGIFISQTQHVEQKVEQKQQSHQEIHVDIDIKVDLPAVQSDFEQLKDMLIQLNPGSEKKLNEIGDTLDEVSPDSDKQKLNKPLNKLGRFLRNLADEDSEHHKLISGTKKAIQLAQKLGKTYNKFGQWLALPQVPELFLGK